MDLAEQLRDGAHDVVGVDDEAGKEGALLEGPQLEQLLVVGDLQRPENPEVQRTTLRHLLTVGIGGGSHLRRGPQPTFR